jgi:glyoxylase-like metal-dependent hydrolase (beta-lactamase superfamily II)/8-oxo-dGTP pyrophosphatase MutT (NUDIX family)
VVLWREGPRGREVFWVRRGEPLAFAGGFYAFPGGRVDPGDETLPILPNPGDPEAGMARATAAREIFEETGVLLVRPASGLAQGERGRIAREELDALRRALLEGKDPMALHAFLARRGLVLDGAALAPAGRWITPPFLPARYDAKLFVASVPAGQEAVVWPGELVEGGWIRCEEALERWRQGRALLHPPNRWAIECLARAAPPACFEEMRAPPYCDGFVTRRIEFQEGIFLLPLRTPTLPPASHTNCYLLQVDGGLAVVDPGAADTAELAALDRALDEHANEGRPPLAIWLTHHHADHVGGVAALAARRRLPIVGHTLTLARLGIDGAELRAVEEGAVLGGRWRVLYTPGHARGHLCFQGSRSGALVCGDMVSTLSTIVIDPPEGDMATYLAQLKRLHGLGPRTLYPAHGAPAPNGVAKLEEYLAHRREREGKVAAALTIGGTLAEITARAYDDTPPAIHPVAERSCLASLEKLAAEGRAQRQGNRWLLA